MLSESIIPIIISALVGILLPIMNPTNPLQMAKAAPHTMAQKKYSMYDFECPSPCGPNERCFELYTMSGN